jgi:predicted nucleic acid-binding protein
MIVVSDTSPLNYLILIDAIDGLPKLYGRVYVPPAVLTELLAPGAPGLVSTWVQHLPAWLQVQAPALVAAPQGIHAGEAQAMALAQELGADHLLIDERAAREAAARLGISVVGTLGVLDEAASRQLVDLPTALHRLAATNFRVSPELIARLLQRDADRRRSM